MFQQLDHFETDEIKVFIDINILTFNIAKLSH